MVARGIRLKITCSETSRRIEENNIDVTCVNESNQTIYNINVNFKSNRVMKRSESCNMAFKLINRCTRAFENYREIKPDIY